ncbi:TetR/AcrR family transcriptional regulator [Allostreptomyces psammosilenae]|uniref:AcrR family transcriptional regulator n=1 Tax=Allostreptomyces psammosilenae TaxID=1892865 RepID=A0A852ZZV6_9ACTN|nr:TetR/AcrR family transcriptional regulator [Allostreptomyces psammosilenae]NYI06750.1 AcrR family transcriptional regulator [Allostreptomyces psammosilenae]
MATSQVTPSGARGMPAKRRVIAEAARVVFGREGYTRASVDAIAAEAGVSKRTIYNHYADKERLFLSVVLDGALEVTRTITEMADRHLTEIADLEADLVTFGLARATAVVSAPDHFAIVRAIHAEAGRIPREVLREWQEAGPLACHRVIVRHLRRIADQGLLAVDDPDLAATHFTLLTFFGVTDRSFYGAIPLPESEVTEIVTTGVRAFLRLYGPPRTG